MVVSIKRTFKMNRSGTKTADRESTSTWRLRLGRGRPPTCSARGAPSDRRAPPCACFDPLASAGVAARSRGDVIPGRPPRACAAGLPLVAGVEKEHGACQAHAFIQPPSSPKTKSQVPSPKRREPAPTLLMNLHVRHRRNSMVNQIAMPTLGANTSLVTDSPESLFLSGRPQNPCQMRCPHHIFDRTERREAGMVLH